MTDAHDPHHLPDLDAHARAAADGLRRHVVAHVDVDGAVALVPAIAPQRRRTRILAIAAVVAMLAGTVAVLSLRADDDRTRVEVDEDADALPAIEPGVLRPLGPRDGKDSIQLPVTAEPSTDLRDGDIVRVSTPGFEPGERVGIVQCAREAGGETPETRGGVDGCNIGTVQYADADASGVATGQIAVQRVLTTPLTGTVDCAAEAKRCLVAMGALSDYDRSGGYGIEFAPGGEPVHLPTVTVTPTEGLSDGDVVHVVADGLTPGTVTFLRVCSSDPAACWQTGEPREVGRADLRNTELVGLDVDSDGRAEADVPVWRFLPSAEPGTYVDCAVSRCSLRLEGETAPPTVPLAFVPGGGGPESPALAVDPSEGLAPGDHVVVRGAGFAPGGPVYVSLCATEAGAPASQSRACMSTSDSQLLVEDDGTLSLDFEIPDLGSIDQGISEECDSDGACTTTPSGPSAEIRCDGITTDCYITVDLDMGGTGRPVFVPSPVRVTFR